MPEPHESTHSNAPIELAFDITKGSGQIKFLGLLEGSKASDNEMIGLFDWICQSCRMVNRDTATIQPQQPFLTTWSCTRCSRDALVRFRARAGTEWIAQHTMALTGQAFSAAAEEGPAPVQPGNRRRQPRHSSQAVFAWIAVPLLAVIILMGVLDMRRVSYTTASPQDGQQRLPVPAPSEQPNSTPSSRIVGYWVSQARDHVVYFSPIDPSTRTGTFTVVYRGGRRVSTTSFTVIQEEAQGDQLVIRENPPADAPDSGQPHNLQPSASAASEAAAVTLNVPRDAKTMTRLDIRDGEPVMTIYDNAGEQTTP